MKIYLIKECWYVNNYMKPTETKSFKTKKAMCKSYENLCNAQDEYYYKQNKMLRKSHIECKINSNFIECFRVYNETNKKEHMPAWDIWFDTINIEKEILNFEK